MLAKIGCTRCGTYDHHEPCASCGVPIHIGSDYRCPHEQAGPSKGFEPYFDIGLGATITGVGDRNSHLRPHWKDDYIIHLQERH